VTSFTTVNEASAFGMLLHHLDTVRRMEQHPLSIDYTRRYQLLISAHVAALNCGIPTGFRLDPKEPDWPVLFFELPTGQASWHIQQHVNAWDGHTTEQKHERIRACLQQQRDAESEEE
jgi:hypothetical protein